jgi:hypothetical protein
MKQSLIILFTIIICLGSCTSFRSSSGTKPNEVLEFLQKKKFTYSELKALMPPDAVDYLSFINGSKFIVGDKTDSGRINLSDAHLGGSFEITKKLHFILYNKSICLIAYREGGFVERDILEYMKYTQPKRHIRYIPNVRIDDTIQLANYLRTNPKPLIAE